MAEPTGTAMDDRTGDRSSIPEALQQWRDAERTAAVARRGRVAAGAAADAAEEAAQAALATADAAKAALASATLAEASALKTATASRLVVQMSAADLADAESELGLADVEEAIARQAYQDAANNVSRG